MLSGVLSPHRCHAVCLQTLDFSDLFFRNKASCDSPVVSSRVWVCVCDSLPTSAQRLIGISRFSFTAHLLFVRRCGLLAVAHLVTPQLDIVDIRLNTGTHPLFVRGFGICTAIGFSQCRDQLSNGCCYGNDGLLERCFTRAQRFGTLLPDAIECQAVSTLQARAYVLSRSMKCLFPPLLRQSRRVPCDIIDYCFLNMSKLTQGSPPRSGRSLNIFRRKRRLCWESIPACRARILALAPSRLCRGNYLTANLLPSP